MYKLTLFSFFVASSAIAAPVVNEQYNYYLVGPSTPQELLPALNKTSTIRQNGQIYHGHTESRINWQFWWQDEQQSCRIERVTVTVNATYTLPQLTSSYPDVNRIWGKWYPNLLKHEQGHKNLAIDIAQQIENAIYNMGQRNSCAQLEQDANAIGRQFIAQLNKLDNEYDKRTKHGETEGASLGIHLKESGIR